MSDAYGASVRDDQRDEKIEAYGRAFVVYQASPTEENRRILVAAAKSSDEAPGGWTSRTKFVQVLQKEFGEDFTKT